MDENKVLNFSLLAGQVIQNFVHYVLLSMFVTSNNLSKHIYMPSLPVHYRRRSKKDSPIGGSVGTVQVSIIPWQCPGSESNIR